MAPPETAEQHQTRRIQELQEPAPTAETEEEDTKEQETYMAHQPGLLEQEIERLLDGAEKTEAIDIRNQNTADIKKNKTHEAEQGCAN